MSATTNQRVSDERTLPDMFLLQNIFFCPLNDCKMLRPRAPKKLIGVVNDIINDGESIYV